MGIFPVQNDATSSKFGTKLLLFVHMTKKMKDFLTLLLSLNVNYHRTPYPPLGGTVLYCSL